MQKVILTILAAAAFTIIVAQQAVVHGQTVTPTPTQAMSVTPSPTTTIPRGAPVTGHGQY